MNNKKTNNYSTLSGRELEILELVAKGLTNQQISENLEISKRTVDNHISNILTKTNTDNRVELVKRQSALGIKEPLFGGPGPCAC